LQNQFFSVLPIAAIGINLSTGIPEQGSNFSWCHIDKNIQFYVSIPLKIFFESNILARWIFSKTHGSSYKYLQIVHIFYHLKSSGTVPLTAELCLPTSPRGC
jgi:hypothetical protein